MADTAVLDTVAEAPDDTVAEAPADPAATEEPVGNLDDGDTADAATTDQEADGV